MNKNIIMLLLALLFATLSAPPVSDALTVGGAVRQPLNLANEDLARFVATEVKLTDFTSSTQFNGVFVYKGIPLQALLGTAVIQKADGGFNKPIDLAIVVRNKEGKVAVLSWGEVFYRNPSNVVVAFSANPVMPHYANGCGKCHAQKEYQPTLDKLARKVGLPKLILANDFFSDRSLEDIISIDVVDLKRGTGKKPDPEPAPTKFTVSDGSGKITELADLPKYRQMKVNLKVVGDGKGFHGYKQFEGVSVRELLEGLNIGNEPDKAMLVTATDGYQGLFSLGEIFLSPLGERIIISEQKEGSIKSFKVVIPDDTSADRSIRTINKIEIFSLK
jgi:hypothetical protein